jgi:hypothetical protein
MKISRLIPFLMFGFILVLGSSVHSMDEVPVAFEDEVLELWGYRDSTGKVVIPARFQIAGEFSRYGIASVADESGWQVIDVKGRTVVRPFLVDNGPDDFSDGLARFQEGGLFGYFDERGQIVIPPRFEFAAAFSEGRAAFCSGCREIRDGEHRRHAGGKWGFIDRQGLVVIPAQFDEVRDFRGGAAQGRTGGQWITIGPEGAPDGSHPGGSVQDESIRQAGGKDEHP